MPTSAASPAPLPRILRLESVDSTNAEAMRRAQNGEPAPFWIVAAAQSEGRGRSGRRWQSLAGNLHASLLTRLSSPAPKAYQLSLVAGVAAVEAIEAAMTLAPAAPLRLKWPNDILIGGAKAGGILVETSAFAGATAAVVGVGVNIARHPSDLAYAATHLAAHGRAPEPHALLASIAAAMQRWLVLWAEGEGFADVRNAWHPRAGPIGEALSIDTGTETVAGRYCGLDNDGALVLREPTGRERRFSFGDVTLAG